LACACLALPAILFAGAGLARAETVTRDDQVVASVGAGLDLAVPSLQERIRNLQAANLSPDDATAALLRDYGSAIDQLELASEWKQRASALERLQRDGPRTLETTRKETEAWPAQLTPPVSGDDTQSELETALAEIDAKLNVVRKGLADVDAEQTQLSDRRQSLPAEMAAADAARESTGGEIALPPLPTGSVESMLARRALALATQKASGEQAAALDLELATQELRRELLAARRELLRRKAETYSARVSEIQAALASRRVHEAEQAAAEANADQASLARVHPLLGELATENARLAAERTGDSGLSAKLDEAARRNAAVSEELQQLEERSKGVHQKVAAAGLTDAIGLLLRKEKGELADPDRARADLRARREEISDVQLESLNLEDMLKALPRVEAEVETILANQAPSLAADDRAKIEASARGALKTRRTYLDALIRDVNTYFASLVDLDAKETQLVALLEDYQAFLDQHVLWIPNTTPTRIGDVGDWRDAAVWLVDPANLEAAAKRVLASARYDSLATSLGLLALLLLVSNRRRMRRLHAGLCLSRAAGSSLLPAPLLVVTLALLLAAPGPFAVWLAGWMLRAAPATADDFSSALATLLGSLAFPLFVAELIRRGAGEKGPIAAFLDWPRASLALVRRQIVFVETVAFPAFAVAVLLDAQPNQGWSETLGRGAFCFAVGAGGVAAHRLFAPDGNLVEQVLRRTDLEWMRPLLRRSSWLPSAIAAVVVGIALSGYYYTAFVLTRCLWLSALVILAFIVANAAVLRWLEAKTEAPPDEVLGDVDGAAVAGATDAAETGTEAVTRISSQTRALLRVVFAIALFAGLFSVWVDVFPALRLFEQVELWQVASGVERTVGSGDAAHTEVVTTQVPVTVASLLFALAGASLAIFGARNLPALLELAVLSRTRLDRGLRYAIQAVTRYLVFIAGSVFALANLGVDWSHVQWLVAAVSVGLGFGLQEIFGNFVSGLILLFERPVRIGDMVTIDNVTGIVTRIEMRATTILDGDRKELIVPNKELITGKLVNWSLHDSTVRLVVPVGVAYGSDPATVVRILQQVAKQCATVLENPAAMAAFTRFGENALEFELRVFLPGPEQLGSTRHELLVDIERRLRAASIDIPFPQRDVNVRLADPALVRALLHQQPDEAT
jgi:potassium efflux system protein